MLHVSIRMCWSGLQSECHQMIVWTIFLPLHFLNDQGKDQVIHNSCLQRIHNLVGQTDMKIIHLNIMTCMLQYFIICCEHTGWGSPMDFRETAENYVWLIPWKVYRWFKLTRKTSIIDRSCMTGGGMYTASQEAAGDENDRGATCQNMTFQGIWSLFLSL